LSQYLLSQIEATAIEQAAKGLQSGNVVYVMMTVIVVLFICSGLAVKYLLGYCKEIHEKAQESFREVSKDHKESMAIATKTFRDEMAATRLHQESIIDKMAASVYTVRDLAYNATSTKELMEKMGHEQKDKR
jgi:uncharacterized ion transporter superfamily protein YfcC